MSTQKENINEAFGRILHMKFKDKKKKIQGQEENLFREIGLLDAVEKNRNYKKLEPNGCLRPSGKR